MRLSDRLGPYWVIGFMGMCKNAGKTTVLNQLVEDLYETHTIGLTSIGYDGEEKDQVTNLKKPRIPVHPGMIIATAASCLDESYLKYKILEDTGIRTILGNILIIEALSSHIVEISGPSMVKRMKSVINKMKDYGCNKVFVDGAAGRTSFSRVCDANILAVGGALTSDLDKLEILVKHQIAMFELEVNNDLEYMDFEEDESRSHMIRHQGSLVDDDLVYYLEKGSKKIMIEHPTSSFLSIKAYHRFRKKGGKLFVKAPLHLLALTINPMTPYGPWLDSGAMKKRLEEVCHLPVINIVEEDKYE